MVYRTWHMIWEFPRIGGPNIEPKNSRAHFIRIPTHKDSEPIETSLPIGTPKEIHVAMYYLLHPSPSRGYQIIALRLMCM